MPLIVEPESILNTKLSISIVYKRQLGAIHIPTRCPLYFLHHQIKFWIVYSDQPVISADYALDLSLYNRISEGLAKLPATTQLSGSHHSEML